MSKGEARPSKRARAIRETCLSCKGGDALAVQRCRGDQFTAVYDECPFWPYLFGTDDRIKPQTLVRIVPSITFLVLDGGGRNPYEQRILNLLTYRLNDWIKKEQEHRAHLEGGTRTLSAEELFDSRADVIQDLKYGCLNFINYLDKNFKAELSQRKANLFPRKWMLSDKTIKDAIDRCPRFLPIINYLHNRNRFTRGEDLQKIYAECCKIARTNNIKQLKDRLTPYYFKKCGGAAYISFFIGRAGFYGDFHRKTDIPEITIKRYIAALTQIGSIVKIRDGGRQGTIYTDGYFLQMPDNRMHKISFLSEKAPGIKERLWQLPDLVT